MKVLRDAKIDVGIGKQYHWEEFNKIKSIVPEGSSSLHEFIKRDMQSGIAEKPRSLKRLFREMDHKI